MLDQPSRPRFLEQPLLWITFAALLAIAPLLVHGTSCGHDLSFHLQNWMEVGQQWKHGILRPFWCFTAAWNAGEPRFVLYPPLSWTLGALLGLLLPWAAIPTAFTFATLLLSGITMHRLLRRFVTPATAVFGACLYVANPYMLFVAYERSAEGELLAAAWMPLVLSALLRQRLDPFRISIAVALLWLTNAPAAVVGSYALLVIGAARLFMEHRAVGLRVTAANAARITAGYAVGLALSSFYLLPAIVQRRSVQIDMAVLPGMRPQDNFLFGHTGDSLHDAVLHTASYVALTVLAAAGLSGLFLLVRSLIPLRWAARTQSLNPNKIHTYLSMHDRNAREIAQVFHRDDQAGPQRTVVVALSVLTVAVAFLLTPASGFLWRHAPELRFLQFPWRFMAVEAASAVALIALAMPPRFSLRMARPAGVVLSAALAFAAHSRFAQPCDDEDAPQAQRDHFLHNPGTEPTDEYTPIEADNDALHPPLPLAWLADTDDAAPSSQPSPELLTISDGNPAHFDFHIAALPAPKMLVIRLRGFRGWRIERDAETLPTATTRDDGLISIPLSSGMPHRITIQYGWTWDETTGLALSAVAGSLCFGLSGKRSRRRI